MSVIKIRGINVQFPYEKPYDIQVDYMNKVIDCLEDKKHGVLESPTGTGKTLCLFAPVTSWLRAKKIAMHQESRKEISNLENAFWGKKQKVYYTARTHSQIAQTVAEVRRCDIEGLAIRVMGARDQLCVNPLVMDEKESSIKTAKCKELVKNRGCRFHRNLEYATHAPAIYLPGEVLDIEDLAKAGRSCGVCPYFLAKAAKDYADVVLMPYNYVIDRESRGNTGGSYDNDIVIFDEGHNVPNTCEESFEFSFTSETLALGTRDIQALMEALVNMKEADVGSEDSVEIYQHADNALAISVFLQNLEKEFSKIVASSALYPFEDLLELFKKVGITKENVEKYFKILEAFQSDSNRLQISGPMQHMFNLLDKILQTLFGSAITSFGPENIKNSFKFAVTSDTITENSKKLSLYCFNPSFGIKDILLQGVQSLIITSGTLSPLRTFIHELNLPDPVTLENGHIASKAQVPFMILGTGVNNVKMDASFKNRKEPAFMYSLGMTLNNLISSVPDGVLLLFSSYSIMQSLKEHWELDSVGIWKRLNSLKRVFVEPRGKVDFINCMENYRRAIDAGNGAILMGVLRGKISEGMDFKDQYCRAVFIVGVPFPPVMDPRVKGKEKYAEDLVVKNPITKKDEKLYGNSFLSVEAMKATNQAIGRVIRHGADYGAIVLVDYRFAWPRLFTNISRWLRGTTPFEVNFMTAKKTLREFFKDVHDGKLGISEVRRQQVHSNGDPIAGDVKFDIYDHKKATNQVPAPFIATSMDNGYFKGRKMKYLDTSHEEEDIMAKYIPPPKTIKKATKEIKTEPTSLFNSLHSSDIYAETSALPGYKEMNDFSLNCELQKRKNDELSPSLLSSQKKKTKRQVVSNFESYHAEPESIITKPSSSSVKPKSKVPLKEDLLNYIMLVKTSLEPDDGIQFKEAVWKYMKKTNSLAETIASIQTLLKGHHKFLEFMRGFNVCVHSKDKSAWQELSSQW